MRDDVALSLVEPISRMIREMYALYVLSSDSDTVLPFGV